MREKSKEKFTDIYKKNKKIENKRKFYYKFVIKL